MRHILAVSVLLSLACMTRAARMTQKWVGIHISTAISEYGPPMQVTPNGLTTIYLWQTSASSKRKLFVTTERTCEMWFEVNSDTSEIQSWHERGDDC